MLRLIKAWDYLYYTGHANVVYSYSSETKKSNVMALMQNSSPRFNALRQSTEEAGFSLLRCDLVIFLMKALGTYLAVYQMASNSRCVRSGF